jgi:CHAT domain-containing protein
LWKVDDDSTADLMGRFYASLKEGRSKDDALRAAQIDLIHGARSTPVTAESGEWSRPFHWAAFTLSGDWQ